MRSEAFVVISMGIALTSCLNRGFNSESDTQWRVSRTVDTSVLREEHAVRVNLKTNMATYYSNGVPKRAWKVASARLDGRSQTPTGTFRFHELRVCPPWTSTRTGASTPACASDNPLGRTALWFESYYGLHGVDSAHISSVTDEGAEARRQSSGCVRNHPSDIAWLTETVAKSYGTTAEELKRERDAGRHKVHPAVGPGVPLIIGRFDDPDGPVAESEATCTTETADAALASDASDSPVPIFNEPGYEIAKVRAWTPVCTTDFVSRNGVAKVFLPVEPEGFAFIARDKVMKCNVRALQVCVKGGGGEIACARRECRTPL